MWSGVKLFLYYDSKPEPVPNLSEISKSASMRKIVRPSCIVLLYNAQVNIKYTHVFSALTNDGVYLHICRCICLTWDRRKSLRANLKDKITQRLKTRMHSNNDFASRMLCHIKLLSFSLENQGIIWQWGESDLFELNATYIGSH